MHMTSNQVLTQSALRVGAFLGLSHAELTQALGVDLRTISAMADGSAELDGNTASGRRALTLIKIHQALTANVGSHEEACKQWVCSHNAGLGGTPALLMHTEMGMEAVLAYLQSMGAPQGM
jgi:uncharacterized protein (DUF2384 family)